MNIAKYSKRNLEEYYNGAVNIFRSAQTEDIKWEARKQMASIERCAMELYGFSYADELTKIADQLKT